MTSFLAEKPFFYSNTRSATKKRFI